MVEKLKSYLRKCFSNGSSVVVSALMVVLVVLVVVVYNTKKVITVCVDDKQTKITTFSDNYKKALENNHINIGPKDRTTPGLNSTITNNGKITIKRAVDVEISVDGRKLATKSAEDNVQKMLIAEKISLGNLDEVKPAKNQPLKQGLKVAVTRVQTKEIKEVKPIDYGTIEKEDDSKEQGYKQVLQEGQSGEKEIITKVIYRDGKEISKKIVSEIIKKQPVQKIVAMGTLQAYTPSRGGKVLYTDSVRMRATAYTSDYESTGKSPGDYDFGITTSGTVAKRDESGYSSVAVDPRVIPLGTKLYIEGYGYAIAEDTGGAIKGNRVDLFVNSESEANDWGVRWVNVYVIK